MKNEKVYIEGRVVGSFADTLGSKGKQIHLISGDIVDVDDSFIIESIEPEKVKVPQFVADWIEECKAKEKNLLKSLLYTPEGVNSWVSNSNNQETFALAWIFGYEVEKEKRYVVKMKGIKDPNSYLKYNRNTGHWFFGSLHIYVNDVDTKIYHTKKQLEEANFGWVFDCEGIKIEEVTE